MKRGWPRSRQRRSGSKPHGMKSVGSFDERHLVDLFESGDAGHHLLDGGLAEEPHPFLPRRLLDFRRRTFLENHLTDVIAQIEQLADRGPPLVAGAAALDAAEPFVKGVVLIEQRIEPRFLEQRAGYLRRPLAVMADVA